MASLDIEQKSKLFREGKDAYSDDVDLKDCPYPEVSGETTEWRRGWLDAEKNDPLSFSTEKDPFEVDDDDED